jgi:hypothetical protein
MPSGSANVLSGPALRKNLTNSAPPPIRSGTPPKGFRLTKLPRALPLPVDTKFVSHLAQHAQEILSAAESATARGEQSGEMTILISQGGGIHMLADSDWPLDSLLLHHGAQSAFRVTSRRGCVRVEAREGQRTCVLESAAGANIQNLLPRCQHPAWYTP